MSRKGHILNECKRIFHEDRSGSFYTRSDRERIMTGVINDLTRIKCLPPSIYKLDTHHIEQLVTYWRDRKYKTETICNRMSAIRTFHRLAKLEIHIPDRGSDPIRIG